MKNITIRYDSIWEYEDCEFTITFPDLPGCITCASTENEGINMAKEVLLLWLDGIKYCELPNRTEINCRGQEKIITIEVKMQLDNGILIDKEGRKNTMNCMEIFCLKKLSKEQYSRYSAIREKESYDEFSREFFKMLKDFNLSDEFYDFM